MPQHTIRRISTLLLTLVCCGFFLGQALAAENTFSIYTPVVLKPGQPMAVTPTGLPVPTTNPTTTNTATPTATTAPSETPTATTAPSETPTATTAPSETPTATSTATPTATTAPPETPTATSTATPTATSTPTATPSATPSATPTIVHTLALTGSVALRPQQRVATAPVFYVVVLDVSGSMMLNMSGQAVIDGVVRQCGAPPSDSPDLQAKYEADAPICRSAPSLEPAWPVVEERRVYIAKQALMLLIDRMRPNDQMQLIASTTNRTSATSSGVQTVGATSYGDAAGKAALKQAALDTGALNGDPYYTRGGTPSAGALRLARTVLEAAPQTAPDGSTYERAVLFMTDGVANAYLDALNNGLYVVNRRPVGWINDAGDEPQGCNRNNVSEDPDCHIGYTQTTTRAFYPRPITAMVNEGQELRSMAQVFVAALAGVNSTGLPMVASSSAAPFYTEIAQAEQLSLALSRVDNHLTAAELGQWYDQIDPAHAPDPAILPEVDATIFGVVTLSGPGGTRTASIQTDPDSGRLVYRFVGLAPGSYTLSAWLGYKSDDGVTRRYTVLTDSDRVRIGTSQSVDLSSVLPHTEVGRALFLVH